MTLLLYARRIGATLGALATMRSVTPLDLDRATLETLAPPPSCWLRALAVAVEADRPPPPLPPLEALAQPFAGTLLYARFERLRLQLAVLHDAAARATGKVTRPLPPLPRALRPPR